MSAIIIKRRDGKFWSDIGRWTAEYPDAFVFQNWKNAVAVAMESLKTAELADIISDYGTENQHTIITIYETAN